MNETKNTKTIDTNKSLTHNQTKKNKKIRNEQKLTVPEQISNNKCSYFCGKWKTFNTINVFSDF